MGVEIVNILTISLKKHYAQRVICVKVNGVNGLNVYAVVIKQEHLT